MNKKMNFLKISFLLLTVSLNIYATEHDREEKVIPMSKQTEQTEDCRHTYIPRQFKYLGVDKERDVVLVRPQNNETISERFWKIFYHEKAIK
jgi:hypothetical protein